MAPLEIACNFFNLVSVYLANRNNVHTWWTGIIGSILFGALFFQAKLYADVNLQIFFIVTSVWGWRNWLYGSKQKVELPITRVGVKQLSLFAFLAVLVTICHGFLLFRLTDASFPFTDSIILVFSVLAQLLLMQRKLENWYCWILVDAIAAPLYWAKELYLTAAIYFVFLILAVWGLINWRKLAKMQEA